jgi:hypothetical protein
MENLAKTMDKNNNALNYLKQKNKKFTWKSKKVLLVASKTGNFCITVFN